MGELDGRVALVTGASRGIGAAIAKRFGAEGARVAVSARTLGPHDQLEGSLLETTRVIEAQGGKALPIVADLAVPTALEEVVGLTESELGPIDILVNNAAAAFFLPFNEMSEKQFRVTTDLNFFAPWRLCQLVVPGMQERGEGWVLNISSGDANLPTQPFKHWDILSIQYGSTKAALERFTAGLAAAVADDGVYANTLAPVGMVPTEGSEAAGLVPVEALAAAESREAMAEAALGLCVTRDPSLTARITYCTPILKELGRDVHTLDGKTRLEGPRESQAVTFRR